MAERASFFSQASMATGISSMEGILQDSTVKSKLPAFISSWFESGGNTQEGQTEEAQAAESPTAVSDIAPKSRQRPSFAWNNSPDEAESTQPAVRLREGETMRIHANDNATEHSLLKHRPAEQVDSEGNPKTVLFSTILDGLVGNETNAQDQVVRNAPRESDRQSTKLEEFSHPEEIKGRELKAEADDAKEQAVRLVQEDSFMRKLAALDNAEDLVDDAPPGELDGLDSYIGPQAVTTYSRLVQPARTSVEGVISAWGGFSSYAGTDEDLEVKWAWREKQLTKVPDKTSAPEGFRVCGVQTSEVQAYAVLTRASNCDVGFTTLFYVDTSGFPKYDLRTTTHTVEQWRNDELIWTGRVILAPAQSGEAVDRPPDLPDTMAQGRKDPIQEAEVGDWEIDDIVFVIGTHCHLPPHKRDSMSFARNLMGYERASSALVRTPNIIGAEGDRRISSDSVRQALLDAATQKAEDPSAPAGELSPEELERIRGPPKKSTRSWGSMF